MGIIHVELEVINAEDLVLVRRGMMPAEDARSAAFVALVDTGCFTLAINENIREELGVPIVGSTTVQLADGQFREMPMAGPIEVRYEGERAHVDALVLPGNEDHGSERFQCS